MDPPPSFIIVCGTTPRLPDAPHPPALLASTEHSLMLRWMRPVTSGTAAALGYRLAFCPAQPEVGTAPDAEWRIVYEGEAEQIEVPSLVPASKYSFQLQV